MKLTTLFLFALFAFFSCSTEREALMPFRNFISSGDRLFPVKSSDAEYFFRFWINNSTSIDRVVSISKTDSLDKFSGYFTEIGFLTKEKKPNSIIDKLKLNRKVVLTSLKIKLIA